MLQTGCSVYLKEITNFYFMYLPECTYTGVFMFSHTFLKLPRLHLGCQDDFFFFFPFNFYFCYSRQKISENQFWAETGNKRSLDIFFFMSSLWIFSLNGHLYWHWYLQFGGAVSILTSYMCQLLIPAEYRRYNHLMMDGIFHF